MATSIETALANIEQLLIDNVGRASINIGNGQSVAYTDLIKDYQRLKKLVARANGSLPTVSKINFTYDSDNILESN